MTVWTNAEDYHQKFELRRWFVVVVVVVVVVGGGGGGGGGGVIVVIVIVENGVKTTIAPMTVWTNAEDYHQKFELRRLCGGVWWWW